MFPIYHGNLPVSAKKTLGQKGNKDGCADCHADNAPFFTKLKVRSVGKFLKNSYPTPKEPIAEPQMVDWGLTGVPAIRVKAVTQASGFVRVPLMIANRKRRLKEMTMKIGSRASREFTPLDHARGSADPSRCACGLRKACRGPAAVEDHRCPDAQIDDGFRTRTLASSTR